AYFSPYFLFIHILESRPGFNDDPDIDPRFYNLDWMESIPDETSVSALSIPGTHESLSLHGGPLAICQVWTLDKQLKMGLRYFDVHVGNFFYTQKYIYIRDSHWMFWQHIDFDEVLRTIFHFLNGHSSECVLVKVTIHGSFEGKPSVPNMKQVRGKIVFIKSKMFYPGTENRESFFFENKKLINVESKVRNIRSQLCGHHIVLTDSAASRFDNPKKLAQTLNKQLNNFVVQHKTCSRHNDTWIGFGNNREASPGPESDTTGEEPPAPDSTMPVPELETAAEEEPAADTTTLGSDLETTDEATIWA
uniref:Phosphatidylinositol-specific phospholipase C X domain-containing protein n=1 Tax=Scophthalmus maximus TaxID=52904 RepID=A0A8D3D5Z3_SCOMX